MRGLKKLTPGSALRNNPRPHLRKGLPSAGGRKLATHLSPTISWGQRGWNGPQSCQPLWPSSAEGPKTGSLYQHNRTKGGREIPRKQRVNAGQVEVIQKKIQDAVITREILICVLFLKVIWENAKMSQKADLHYFKTCHQIPEIEICSTVSKCMYIFPKSFLSTAPLLFLPPAPRGEGKTTIVNFMCVLSPVLKKLKWVCQWIISTIVSCVFQIYTNCIKLHKQLCKCLFLFNTMFLKYIYL